jgi:hypothetical protein
LAVAITVGADGVASLAGLTVKLCVAWVAALKLLFPAWFACRTHVPAERKETTPELIEHIAEDEPATVMVVARPDVAVAVGV